MEFGDTTDVGRRLGMFMSILSIGALTGPPISGAINLSTGKFADVGFYAGMYFLLSRSIRSLKHHVYLGTMILIGVAFMAVSRHLVLKRVWGKF